MAASLRVNDDLAELYHEESKYAPHTLPRLLAAYRRYDEWRAAQPFPIVPVKRYPAAPFVALPDPRRLRMRLGRAIDERRSRPPTGLPLPLASLATILAASGGLRPDRGRRAPSAGGLYPLEWYVAARDVPGLETGAYHYDPHRQGLERLGDARGDEWLLDAETFRPAAAFVVVTAVLPRLKVKYDERAYRFALLEAGHAAQNALLAAEAVGAGAVPVGGYYDDRVHDALELDGVEEVALYVLAFGGRRSTPLPERVRAVARRLAGRMA